VRSYFIFDQLKKLQSGGTDFQNLWFDYTAGVTRMYHATAALLKHRSTSTEDALDFLTPHALIMARDEHDTFFDRGNNLSENLPARSGLTNKIVAQYRELQALKCLDISAYALQLTDQVHCLELADVHWSTVSRFP
jgi:hypothetical protein